MSLAVIGYMAGFCTTASFVPQVIRAWRTRHTDDLAWGWLIIFECGLGLWLTYGVILHDWPMILSNSITMTMCSALMVMKIRFSRKHAKLARAEAAN